MADRAPLTREEFEAVVDRATKTAPAGLSPEDFDRYVQEAATHDEAAKAASVAPAGANVTFSPAGVVKGFLSSLAGAASGTANAVMHPIDTASGLVQKQFDEFGKAARDVRAGHYSEAAGHGVAGMLPLVGPAAADIGERAVATGDVGHAVGEAASLAALSSPSATSAALRGAGRGTQAFSSAIQIPARYAGAASIFHGTPLIGGAIMAAPPLARALGRGLSRAGDSMAALRDAAAGPASDAIARAFEDDAPPMSERPAPNPDGRSSYDVGKKWESAVDRPYRAGGGVSGGFDEGTPTLSYREQPASGETRYAEEMDGGPGPEFQQVDPNRTVSVRTTSTGDPFSGDPVFERFTPRDPDAPGPSGMSAHDIELLKGLIRDGYNPRTAARIAGQGTSATPASLDALARIAARER